MILSTASLPIIRPNEGMALQSWALQVPTNEGRTRVVLLSKGDLLYRLTRYEESPLSCAPAKFRNGRCCPYEDKNEFGVYYTSATPETAGRECNVLAMRNIQDAGDLVWIKNHHDATKDALLPPYHMLVLEVTSTCGFVDLHDEDTARMFGLARTGYKAGRYSEWQSATTNILRWTKMNEPLFPIPIVGVSHLTKAPDFEGRNFNFFDPYVPQFVTMKSKALADFSSIATVIESD